MLNGMKEYIKKLVVIENVRVIGLAIKMMVKSANKKWQQIVKRCYVFA